MIAFSTGPTAAERLTQGFTERKYGSDRKHTACTSENTDAVEELVMPQTPYGGGIKQCFCLTSVCHVHRA